MDSTDSLNEAWQTAIFHFEQNRPLLPMYLHLLVSALFPIYIGSFASLSRPSSAAKPEKKESKDEDEEDEDTVQKMEGLSAKDAVVFPITAGIVLSALYFLIKKFGADPINLVLGVYFSLIGTYSVAKIINDTWTTVESFVSPTYFRDQGKLWKVNNSERKVVALDSNGKEIAWRNTPLAGLLGRLSLPGPLESLVWSLRDLTKQKFAVKGYLKDHFDFSAIMTRHNALSTIIGIVAISYSIFIGKPWWLTNLQGFAVSYGALQLMSPTTFTTGTLILTGLFFYDIWAVFFTPLMVTVAKNLDVPIKLVFPRPDEPGKEGKPPVKSFSMLGLGDIVLPGLMIALALRFDLYMFYLRKQKKVMKPTGNETDDKKEEVEKAPYVTATGHWGDRLWTAGAASSPFAKVLPEHLMSSFPKPYFHATLVGYVVGMLATLVAMSVFQHAQPALLYLVPGVVTCLWLKGFLRGELKEMWEYTEALNGEPTEDGEDTDSKDKESKEKESEPKSLLQWAREEIFGDGNSDKSAKEKADEKKSENRDDKENVGNDSKSSPADKSTIFSFSITHHKHKSGVDDDDSTSNEQEGNTSEKDGKKHGPSDSISDDTVVVSSADLEGVKNGETRQRAINTKGGEARLD